MNPASIFFMWVIWFVRPRKRVPRTLRKVDLDARMIHDSWHHTWHGGDRPSCPKITQIRRVLLLAERLQ